MILVTGGSGLVGKCLIQTLLNQGEKVRAIYHHTPLPKFEGPLQPEIFKADLMDVFSLEDAMKGIDKIYNCAGFISYNPSDKEKLFRINVTGTANLVNAALDANIKKLVHVSSVAALGRHVDSNCVTEEMMWSKDHSNSNYGHSKFLGEMEVWRGFAEGLNMVIVNPSLIFGDGNWNEGSTKIFKSVYDEFPWYTEAVNGMIDVRDLVDVMIRLMKSDIHAEKFIVSAHNISYKDLFFQIADTFGKKRPSKKVTPFLARLVYNWEALKSKFTGVPPLLTKETAATALTDIHYDNSKIVKALPEFAFRPFSETITWVCDALQQKINRQ